MYCDKEFLTDSPEPSTSTVVSFYGDVQWSEYDRDTRLGFVEVSNCHERARLHKTYSMSDKEWYAQVVRLRDHLNRYLEFLEDEVDV